jgi:nucleobase:cation symporter-1, NCS1 family
MSAVEPHGIEHIPADEQHGSPVRSFTLWFAANLCMATFVVGVLAGTFGLGLYEALGAIVLGNGLGMACLGGVSSMGPRAGVPQMVLTRASFGFRGAYLPAFFNWLACIGWFAVNTILGVLAFEQLLHVPYVAAVAVLVIAQVALAIYGYDLIHAYERLMSYVLCALFLVATVRTLEKLDAAHGHAVATGGFHPAMFVLLAAAALGYALGWTPYGADFSRYLPSRTPARRAFGLTFLAGFISAVWLEALGALIAELAVSANSNPVVQLTGVMGGFAAPMLVAIILGTAASNVLNLYSGALSSLVLNAPLKRPAAAILIGALGTVLLLVAGTDPLRLEGDFTNFLLVLAYWIGPWLAIVLLDFYLFRRGRYTVAELYRDTGLRWTGLIAYLAGLAASIPFISQSLFTGPVARDYLGGADISYCVGFLVAGALYLVLARPRMPRGAL